MVAEEVVVRPGQLERMAGYRADGRVGAVWVACPNCQAVVPLYARSPSQSTRQGKRYKRHPLSATQAGRCPRCFRGISQGAEDPRVPPGEWQELRIDW